MLTFLFLISLAMECMLGKLAGEGTAVTPSSLTVHHRPISTGAKEEFLQVDTVRISPTIRTMIFKYFQCEDGYKFDTELRSARFEVSFVGDRLPFQSDTVSDIKWVSYEDANFDHIRDIRIVTNIGMSGDNNTTDYYFYDSVKQRFEYGIGGLSNPYVNPKDSSISCSGYCCMGKSGNDEVLKFADGAFRIIEEYEYSENGSFTQKLMGDSMVVTERETVSHLADASSVDSSWQYLYGTLRIVNVTRRMELDRSPTPEESNADVAYEDVRGSFLLQSKYEFEYSVVNGRLTRMCRRSEVKNGEWKLVGQTSEILKN